MSKSLNKVMLIGHLGEDPSLRYTQAGTAVANLSIATNHSVKRGDQWEDVVSWHRAVVWDKKAEACGEFLRKGSKVFFEGRLETKNWTDGEGVKRWATEVIVRDIIFLDSKGQGQRSDQPPAPPKDEESPGAGQAGGYDASEEPGSENVPF